MDLDTEFLTIEKADYCIVLSAREDAYVLNQKTDVFLTKAKNILIYAESVELNGSIKLPGRNLAFVCNTLAVTGTSDVTIDVSGANGSPQPAKAVGGGDVGNDGESSGTVFISVENPAADLTRLHVRALGGDGGQGGATSDSSSTAKGGNGGKGGDAGKITVLFTNLIHEARTLFERGVTDAGSTPWNRLVNFTKDVLSQQKSPVPATPSVEFLAAMGNTLNSGIPDAQLAQQLRQTVRSDLSKYSQLAIYSKVTKLLEGNLAINDLKAQLQSSLSSATSKALDEQLLKMTNEEDKLRESLSSRLSSSPGRGGRGGTASSDLKQGGTTGADGKAVSKTQECRYMPGPGEDFFLDLDFPTCFPDEARMLMKRADAQFMTNTGDSVNAATKLYERLVRRLYYVPQLTLAANSSTPLAQLFTNTFEKSNICVAPLSELQGVLDEARARLSRIQLGQDMFGQSAIWAPRLSYFYYEKRIGEMITDYRSLTKELDKYRTKSEKADEQREAVANVRDLVQKESASVQSRLDAILNENGPLQATAYRVRSYDPRMKDQQRHLKTQMQSVADQIKSSINVSKLIDAFTTMASSTSKADAAKNALKAGYSIYQSVTVVEDADGQSFDKDLIVKKVTSCGDTLESLNEALSGNDDGSVALEDPGAVKVITTQENITKMLDQFRNILPESIRTTTNKMLQDFLNTVTTRNNAVLEYNALLHSVQELQSMKKQQAKMIEALSDKKLQQVDPKLPAIVNFLRRSRDDLSLATMQYLNYASRAIRYWGLFDGLPLDKPGPLRGTQELEQIQGRLRSSFDAALTDFASTTWDTWGSADSWGRLYKLSKEELTTLTQTGRTEKGKAVYSVNIPLAPETAGMAGIGSNVRIRQIRLWLANAYVDASQDESRRQILTVTLTHNGTENIQKDDTRSFKFEHSPVKINFRYHCGQVKSLDNAKKAAVYGQQIIENDFQTPTVGNANASSIAPLGPFTIWTATIREVDNPGLDLSKVDGAWIEFWGRSKP